MKINTFTPIHTKFPQQTFGAIPLASLSATDELELVQQVVRGEPNAVKRLFEHGDKIIRLKVIKYLNRGLTSDELVAAGRKGLLRAAQKYTSDDGRRLSPYAEYWIRQAIQREIANNGRNVRIPVHMVTDINRYRKASQAMAQELGREPLDQELAERLGVKLKKLQKIKNAAAQESLSLDGKIFDREGDTFISVLKDRNAASQDELTEKAGLRIALSRAVESLNPRMVDILKLSVGMNGFPLSDGAIAEILKISRVRVWQFRTKALALLRENPQLQAYANNAQV